MPPARIRPTLAAALIAATLACPATPAAADSAADRLGLGDLFGLGGQDDLGKITMSAQELQSLGCLVGGAGIGVASVLFGGAAIIVTRGQGAAAVTTVAVPVLATAIWAGCSAGSQLAPGLAWLRRNGDSLFGKVVSALPVEPLSKVLPGR